MGNPTHGPNMTVDTSLKFTMITQFLTSDNTTTEALREIRRVYIQDGKVIQNATLSVAGITPTNAPPTASAARRRESLIALTPSCNKVAWLV